MKYIFLVILSLSMCGCFTRTIYVPHGQPVRLRQDIKNVKIWALDADGKPVPGNMDLEEGWFCGPKE